MSVIQKSNLLPKGVIALTLFLVAGCGTTVTMGGMDHGTTTTESKVAGLPESGTDNSVPAAEVATGGKLEVTLTAAETQVHFRNQTRWAMTYNGSVSGPTIRIHPGDQLTINLVNNLSKPTSLHTHGLHVDPAVDDPFLMVEPGQSHKYVYQIPANQQAGTYWYHPHVHQLTAEQVASGLSGAIVVENATDDALKASSTDRVLVINDPLLVTENPWTGQGNGVGGMGAMMGGSNPNPTSTSDTTYGRGINMMQSMMGRVGQLVLTNGYEGVNFTQSGGKLERLRVVNATSSTQLHFTYEGKQLLQLATGGGRLETAKSIDSIDLGPGDRTEVVLIPNADGGKLFAQRVSNEGANAVSATKELIASIAANAGTDTSALPTTMSANTRDLFASDVKLDNTRTITLDGHMTPKIDGKLFDPSVINVAAKKGTIEEWVIKSNSPMSHPFHLHTWGFQIQGQAGWHDEVLVPAHQTVTIRVAFDDFSGLTVLHCHILDHEDTGMMATIKVS